MKKVIIASLIVMMVVGLGIAFAAKPKDPDTGSYFGNGLPSGPHFNLNLVGHPKEYTGNGGDNGKRHTILVPLITVPDASPGYDPFTVTTDEPKGGIRIYFRPGPDFAVIDGDATDGEATFEVPGIFDPGTGDLIEVPRYEVYAAAGGKPNKKAEIDAWWTYEEDTVTTYVYIGHLELKRDRGKPKWENCTYLFEYTGDITYDPDGSGPLDPVLYEFRDEWVWDIDFLQTYFWNYFSNGLRLAKFRFYPVPEE